MTEINEEINKKLMKKNFIVIWLHHFMKFTHLKMATNYI